MGTLAAALDFAASAESLRAFAADKDWQVKHVVAGISRTSE